MATSTKAWQVGPYGMDWVVIVHADTRGRARALGSRVEFSDYIDMRAIRLPSLDGKLITKQSLLDAGFPEEWEGYPLDPFGYIDFCDSDCELCKQSRIAILEAKCV